MSQVPPAIAADLDATTTGTVTVAVVTSAAEHDPNPSRTLEGRASEFKISETSYTSDYIMSSHARIGKDSGEKFYSCDYPECGGKFLRHINLHQHMGRMHNNDERPLKCSVDGCQFGYNTVGKPSDSDQQMPQYAPLLLFNFIPKPLYAITRSRVLDQQRGRVCQARKNRHSLRQKVR
ncbi:Zinc finger, C2H2-type/integrase, DNA-binding protein [Beauveria brongniartii RCEF 3172]|uniref:Zinc finger, C2H2-type/integrase, DNA-binding protein n=1 Tax=Beauveria brongniartii RCEF 3172 TaxID=1081107 RepID=A0A166W7P2_9HYPO|nr:Zinc finger, C2H2-type/integrase, DNA-binding protein [Beauveria brongniartii RCEF 3172]